MECREEASENVCSGLGSELRLPLKPGPRHPSLFLPWTLVHLFMQQGRRA